MKKDSITFTNENHPLVLLYGENALNEATDIINELKRNSNIDLNGEIMSTGIGFLNLKAMEIQEGKKMKTKLESLVSESFGEAAMFVLQFKDTYFSEMK